MMSDGYLLCAFILKVVESRVGEKQGIFMAWTNVYVWMETQQVWILSDLLPVV